MDKMIEKVRALLALASDDGATEAEATLAAERAQEMMLKYGIDLAQVAMSSGQAMKIGADAAFFTCDVKPWTVDLASGVAGSVGGKIVIRENHRFDRQTVHGGFTFICPAGTADVVTELFSWLHIQLSLLSTTAMKNREETWVHGRQWRRSWLQGAASRIDTRLCVKYQKAQQAPDTGSALVLMRDAVADKQSELFPKLGRYTPARSGVNGAAYGAGAAAGAAMNLGGPQIGQARRTIAA